MRYNQLIPAFGFTHAVFYGADGFADLERAVGLLAQRYPPRRDFWISNWRAVKFLVSERFRCHPDTRAIVLHHRGNPGGRLLEEQSWNSLYIASPAFAQNILNCECFGHDYQFICHIPGDWSKDANFDLRYEDEDYLRTIDPMAPLPRAAVPRPAAGMRRAGGQPAWV
jgi:hypothetical protein